MLSVALLPLAALAGCGHLEGLGGPEPPLARIQVEVTGDLAPLRPADTLGETPHLRVALVWAAQWLPEPFCVLPPTSSDAAAVMAAGCPDSFGFVPARVAANVPVDVGAPATIDLVTLPGADVMIGDVTARIAYGSLVVYDDRNGDGTLDLQEVRRFGEGDAGSGPPAPDADIIYGASLASMTLPDQRVAFREGVFNAAAAFYPREGCPDPPKGFSILSAGGFSEAEAIGAVLNGELPQEDPARCAEEPLDTAVVSIPLQAHGPLRQLACLPRRYNSGGTRYRQPTDTAPDLSQRAWACTSLPSFDAEQADTGTQQLVFAGLPTDACLSLTHYILRGCEDDPACQTPQWDETATPPA